MHLCFTGVLLDSDGRLTALYENEAHRGETLFHTLTPLNFQIRECQQVLNFVLPIVQMKWCKTGVFGCVDMSRTHF